MTEKIACKSNIKIWINAEEEFFEEFKINKHYSIEETYKNSYDFPKIILRKKEVPQISWISDEDTILIDYVSLDNSVYNAADILINTLFIMELERRNIYLLHASCVYFPEHDKILILWGDSGAGKTTTMLELVEKHNFEYISNGTTEVRRNGKDSYEIFNPFKKRIKLRASSVKLYDNQLFSNYFLKNNSKEKIEIFPEDLGLKIYEGEKINKNIAIYFIKLSNSPLIVNREINYRNSMLLFHDIARHMKFSDLYLEINGNNVFLTSIDSENLFENRVNFVNNILEEKFKGYIHGKLDDVVKFILEDEEIQN